MISHKRLLELYDYSIVTGIFYRKVSRPGYRKGEEAGCVRKIKKDGMLRRFIVADGKQYRASRLAWFYVTGKWPKNQIDHINRDALCDAFHNLRDSNNSANQINKGIAKNNTSGCTGVMFHKPTEKWVSVFRRKSLGYFDDWFDAVCCRKSAEAKYVA